MTSIHAATVLLEEASRGSESAANRLVPLVYGELRALATSLMRREDAGSTLQPTALVNEVYLKLVDQRRADVRSQTHFLAIAAEAMRRILVDHARHHLAAKRGGGRRRLTIDVGSATEAAAVDSVVDVLAVDDALHRLTDLDARAARVVELRFFAGMTEPQVAMVLGVSERTLRDDWRFARAWLRRELNAEQS